MEKKYPVPILAGGALLAVFTAADQLLWQDPSTGFCKAGPFWLRYLFVGAVLLAVLLPGRRVGAAPAALVNDGAVRALRLALLFSAAVGGALDLLGGAHERWTFALGFFQLVSALWLCTSLRHPANAPLAFPQGNALFGMAGTFSLYFLTLQRFVEHQTGLARVNATMNIFSATAALLLSVTVLWMLYVPGKASASALSLRGTAAFLLCTCVEFPRSVCMAIQGVLFLPTFFCSFGLAVAGLFGLYAAASQPGKTNSGAANA